MHTELGWQRTYLTSRFSSPGLREHKSAQLPRTHLRGRRLCPKVMRDQTREIVGLESTNPRKGYATTLMWSVCHEADTAGITLILQPRPFGDAALDEGKLERFYMRFGFVVFQKEPVVLMARTPVRKRLVTLQ
jgi:hypothetical protein